MPRQRHDLTVKPGIKDDQGRYIPTPLFVPSAEGRNPLERPEPSPFGQLLWSPANRKGEHTEVTAHSPQEVEDLIAQGYLDKPPYATPEDPMEKARREFASFSPEDQKFLIEMQQEDKKQRMRELIATLTPDDFAELTGAAPKRGPGRPKKTA